MFKKSCTKNALFLLLICEISKMKIEAELQNALRLNSKDKINYVFEKLVITHSTDPH